MGKTWLRVRVDELNLPVADFQFGFAKEKSTRDCIAMKGCLWERLTKMPNLSCCEQFWDQSKAFDELSKEEQVQAVADHNPSRTDIVNEIKDHLANNVVEVQGNFFHTKCGVPQGGTLGPALFRTTFDKNIKEWKEEREQSLLPRQVKLIAEHKIFEGGTEEVDCSTGSYADDVAHTSASWSRAELEEIAINNTLKLKTNVKKINMKTNDEKGEIILHTRGTGAPGSYNKWFTGGWRGTEGPKLQAKHLGVQRRGDNNTNIEMKIRIKKARDCYAMYSKFFNKPGVKMFTKKRIFEAIVLGTMG